MTNSTSFQLTRAYVERVLDGPLVHAYTPAKPHTLTLAAGGSTMRLRSIGLIVTLAPGILLAPLAADAQPAWHSSKNGLQVDATDQQGPERVLMFKCERL